MAAIPSRYLRPLPAVCVACGSLPIALCLFGFASGYFTALIYGSSPQPLAFAINCAASARTCWQSICCCWHCFCGKGRHIFNWQSLLGVFGLSGWLNWLYLPPNPSPFGAGLWYFTLLLLFYLGYPLLTRSAQRSGWVTGIVCAAAAGVAAIRTSAIRAHMLWFYRIQFLLRCGTCQPALARRLETFPLLLTALVSGFVLAWWLFGAPLKGLLPGRLACCWRSSYCSA